MSLSFCCRYTQPDSSSHGTRATKQLQSVGIRLPEAERRWSRVNRFSFPRSYPALSMCTWKHHRQYEMNHRAKYTQFNLFCRAQNHKLSDQGKKINIFYPGEKEGRGGSLYQEGQKHTRCHVNIVIELHKWFKYKIVLPHNLNRIAENKWGMCNW